MKIKMTFALAAMLTSSAFAAFKAPLPEFKTEKQLAEWRTEMAAKEAATSTSENSAFYTGKPYVESSGSYAFKYRSYNPELARWTSEDPSGFPDGANSQVFVPAPSFMFDSNGLEWVYYYQFSTRTWECDTHVESITEKSFLITGFSANIGFDSNGPTGGVTLTTGIQTNATVVVNQNTSELTYAHDMDPPTGEGWSQVGSYTMYRSNSRTVKIRHNLLVEQEGAQDRYINEWTTYAFHQGYQAWKKWE